MKQNGIRTLSPSSAKEIQIRKDFYDLFSNCPIPENEVLKNLGLFLNRQTLTSILHLHELYKKIINVHGSVIEFGTRWGQQLALCTSLRGLYEPYNYSRKIIGFDTFEGFPSSHTKDGDADIASKGAYSVTKNYKEYLGKVLQYHEQESPLSHIKKYELIQGDMCITFKKYLEDNPHTIVALAYFDCDIYEPTKKCLLMLKDHVTKGTIIVFDELNHPMFPGETVALKEVFALDEYRIERSPLSQYASYIVIE